MTKRHRQEREQYQDGHAEMGSPAALASYREYPGKANASGDSYSVVCQIQQIGVTRSPKLQNFTQKTDQQTGTSG